MKWKLYSDLLYFNFVCSYNVQHVLSVAINYNIVAEFPGLVYTSLTIINWPRADLQLGQHFLSRALEDNCTEGFIAFEMQFASILFYHFSTWYSLVTEMLWYLIIHHVRKLHKNNFTRLNFQNNCSTVMSVWCRAGSRDLGAWSWKSNAFIETIAGLILL